MTNENSRFMSDATAPPAGRVSRGWTLKRVHPSLHEQLLMMFFTTWQESSYTTVLLVSIECLCIERGLAVNDSVLRSMQ